MFAKKSIIGYGAQMRVVMTSATAPTVRENTGECQAQWRAKSRCLFHICQRKLGCTVLEKQGLPVLDICNILALSHEHGWLLLLPGHHLLPAMSISKSLMYRWRLQSSKFSLDFSPGGLIDSSLSVHSGNHVMLGVKQLLLLCSLRLHSPLMVLKFFPLSCTFTVLALISLLVSQVLLLYKGTWSGDVFAWQKTGMSCHWCQECQCVIYIQGSRSFKLLNAN